MAIIKMGNIQVVGSESRRKPIFDHLNSSQYRPSKSPRQNDQSTHRFTNNNRVYKIKDNDGEDTSRVRNTSNYHRSSQKKSEVRRVLPQAISEVSQTEGNRVVNFNDFLIEIKKQMTENSDHSSQLEQTLRRGQEDRLYRGQSNRQLKVNLRLENQRFQLDKYKKLVERQLSKSHSIQNISLQNKTDNEKLLIIKYGQYGNEVKEATMKPLSFKNASSLSFGTPIKKEVNTNGHLNDKIAKERQMYCQTLKSAQRLMREMKERMESLGVLLGEHERPDPQPIEPPPNKEEQNLRIDRISELMSGLHSIQNQQLALQSQIKAAIFRDDDSDISETLTERQLTLRQELGRR